MNNEYIVKPIDKLTEDVIKSMIIHQTLSSLRRAGSVSPYIQRVEGNLSIPTLFYIKGSRNPDENDWTIHALMTDVNKFLLADYVNSEHPTEGPTEDPTEEPTEQPTEPSFEHSSINWDPGKTGGENLQIIKDGGIFTFNGNIKWYPEDKALNRSAGNRVGVVITPAKGMLEKYPNVKVEISGKTYGKEVFNEYPSYEPKNSLYYYPLIKVAGQECPVNITWSEGIEEHFTITVTQESSLDLPEGTELVITVPENIKASEEVESPMTFKSETEYKGIRFKFKSEGPGNVTFKATDSQSQEIVQINEGYWGPEQGFDVPIGYDVTTNFKTTFELAGKYEIELMMIYAKDNSVINRQIITVNVK